MCMTDNTTNACVDEHDDLRRAARNAITAYMHHKFYEHHKGSSTTIAIIHAAADHCLRNATGIVDKAIAQLEKTA